MCVDISSEIYFTAEVMEQYRKHDTIPHDSQINYAQKIYEKFKK